MIGGAEHRIHDAATTMTIDAAFTQFPTLSTSRLRLRQITTADAEALFAIKSDLEVTKHYGQEPHRSLESTLAWILRLQADYERREALAWGVTLKDDDRVIGSCVFWNFGPGLHCAEVGYELHRAYQQQGIMTEALSAMVTYGFGELGLRRIEAVPLEANSASQALLRRLGFVCEGNLRQRHFFRGGYEDQLYFGVLREEWLKSA